jgi:3-methyladenine DNA glycosylase/8-oxoguanine DNA glycosylase
MERVIQLSETLRGLAQHLLKLPRGRAAVDPESEGRLPHEQQPWQTVVSVMVTQDWNTRMLAA